MNTFTIIVYFTFKANIPPETVCVDDPTLGKIDKRHKIGKGLASVLRLGLILQAGLSSGGI